MKILGDKILMVKMNSTEKDSYSFEVSIDAMNYKATQTVLLLK